MDRRHPLGAPPAVSDVVNSNGVRVALLFRLLQRAFRRRPAAPAAELQQPSLAPTEATTPANPQADPDELVAAASGLAQLGELNQARELLDRALAIAPEHAGAHDVLGSVFRAQDRLEQAVASYRRALGAEPLRVSALSNIALCMRGLGQYEGARTYFEQALRLDPANPVVATNLAALLFDTGHFDEANARIEAVLREHPDYEEAHVVWGTRLLRRGEWARGWSEYEWRERHAGQPCEDGLDYPAWDGTPVTSGYLLVCGEQGLGDQIMFTSCVDDLLRVAPRCILVCDARLKALFVRSFPQVRFYVQRGRTEEIWLRDGLVPSARTWLGSLPGRFRRQAADFPQRASYLRADRAKTERWSRSLQALGPGIKIGISWRGGTGTTRRALRSIALEEWVPLLRCPATRFISLQYGECHGEIERVCGEHGVSLTHWDGAIQDYDETAALVNALDLVVSVQTALVHLAGALGKPVWVLLPSVAEWRYGEHGERMPWYPSARLYRQNGVGDWSKVLRKIHLDVSYRSSSM